MEAITPEAGVAGSCELPGMRTGNYSDPLGERYTLLTAGSSLQHHDFNILW